MFIPIKKQIFHNITTTDVENKIDTPDSERKVENDKEITDKEDNL